MSDPAANADDRIDDASLEEEVAAHDADLMDGEDEAAEPDDANEFDRLRDENRQLYEKLARIQADYQNSQRRLQKDADQRLKIAAGHLVRDFLPVLDNFERALEVPETADLKTVLAGLRGTHAQWLDVLKANGVEPIAPAAGDPFDPERHEALMQEPVDEMGDSPHVTRTLQKGYAFDGRILRNAQVAVSRPA